MISFCRGVLSGLILNTTTGTVFGTEDKLLWVHCDFMSPALSPFYCFTRNFSLYKLSDHRRMPSMHLVFLEM